jgi:hypothetical protein
MATIERRTGRDGQLVYRITIRRKGYPPQTATFAKLSDARKWAQVTEGAVLTDRHFTTPEAKRHTFGLIPYPQGYELLHVAECPALQPGKSSESPMMPSWAGLASKPINLPLNLYIINLQHGYY